jgi:hypothetical protein
MAAISNKIGKKSIENNIYLIYDWFIAIWYETADFYIK